jgi:hypothetical protein
MGAMADHFLDPSLRGYYLASSKLSLEAFMSRLPKRKPSLLKIVEKQRFSIAGAGFAIKRRPLGELLPFLTVRRISYPWRPPGRFVDQNLNSPGSTGGLGMARPQAEHFGPQFQAIRILEGKKGEGKGSLFAFHISSCSG